MNISPNTKTLLKHTSVLYVIFLVCIALLISIAYALEKTGDSWENFASLAIMLLLYPAIIIRQWLFEIPGANLSYHYYLALGAIDFISLIVFYYLVCLTGVWAFTSLKCGSHNHGNKNA